MTESRTLVFGEALIDIVRAVDGSEREHVGGSPLNVAIGLARLHHQAALATYIGQDARGQAIVDHLAADGVALTEGSDTAKRTSTATASLDESGSATYEFAIAWEVPRLPFGDFGHLHTGSIAGVLQPGASAVRDFMLEARGQATVSYDPNARPSLMGEPHLVRSDIEQLVGLADVVKASDEDIDWLYGAGVAHEEIARLWGQLGPSLVVVTRGADGALVYVSRSQELLEVPGRSVEVVDTVGAGDSFMSGLLSGLLDADLIGGVAARDRLRRAALADVVPAVERATATSAVTVTRAGAQPPTRADL